MTERPILFSDSMVRAILVGTKTQTRRVIAGARGAFWDHRSYTGTVERDGVLRFREGSEGTIVHGSPEVRCPYGAVGDQLWVREAWSYYGGDEYLYQRDPIAVSFRASDDFGGRPIPGGRWRPSIHMPRWASRLTLEVTSVRVERVQSISEDDARAEGVARAGGFMSTSSCWMNCGSDGPSFTTARGSFMSLWDSINGEREGCSWADDPWVWVVGFRRVTQWGKR